MKELAEREAGKKPSDSNKEENKAKRGKITITGIKPSHPWAH